MDKITIVCKLVPLALGLVLFFFRVLAYRDRYLITRSRQRLGPHCFFWFMGKDIATASSVGQRRSMVASNMLSLACLAMAMATVLLFAIG